MAGIQDRRPGDSANQYQTNRRSGEGKSQRAKPINPRMGVEHVKRVYESL